MFQLQLQIQNTTLYLVCFTNQFWIQLSLSLSHRFSNHFYKIGTVSFWQKSANHIWEGIRNGCFWLFKYKLAHGQQKKIIPIPSFTSKVIMKIPEPSDNCDKSDDPSISHCFWALTNLKPILTIREAATCGWVLGRNCFFCSSHQKQPFLIQLRNLWVKRKDNLQKQQFLFLFHPPEVALSDPVT